MLCHSRGLSFNPRPMDPGDTRLTSLNQTFSLPFPCPRLGGDSLQSFCSADVAVVNRLCWHEAGARSVAEPRVLASKLW